VAKQSSGGSGKPQQNGFIKSFNRSLRDELLNEEVFDRRCSRRSG
jgi:putative transposase